MTSTRAPRFLPQATRATLHVLRGELNILAGAAQAGADPASRRAVLRIGQLADELEWRLFVAAKTPVPTTTLDLSKLAGGVALEMQAAGYPVALSVTTASVRPVPVVGNDWLVCEILNLLIAQALNQVWGSAERAGTPVTLAVSARPRAAQTRAVQTHAVPMHAVSLTWHGELEGALRRVPVATLFRPVEEQPGAVRGFALGLYAANLLAERLGGRVTFTRSLQQSQCRTRLILPAPRSEA